MRSAQPSPARLPRAEDPARRPIARVLLPVVIGLVVVAAGIGLGVPTSAYIGGVVGMVLAVVVQRVELAWFAAGVRRSEGAEWMDRLPPSLAALRRPLRLVEEQIVGRVAELQDASARERLRDVAVDALEMEVDTLDRALDDARGDMAEVLAALDRSLGSKRPDAVLRRELVELRELVRLNVYAELPSEEMSLGDCVAEVVAGGAPRGSLVVAGSLPSIQAPPPLVEALIRAVVGIAMAGSEQPVELRGLMDGAMIVLIITSSGDIDESIHGALGRRAAGILGGDIAVRGGVTTVVVPRVFTPGVKPIRPAAIDWDFPEAI
jgi:hypothetical protein